MECGVRSDGLTSSSYSREKGQRALGYCIVLVLLLELVLDSPVLMAITGPNSKWGEKKWRWSVVGGRCSTAAVRNGRKQSRSCTHRPLPDKQSCPLCMHRPLPDKESCPLCMQRPLHGKPSCPRCKQRPLHGKLSRPRCMQRPLHGKPSCPRCMQRPFLGKPSCPRCTQRPFHGKPNGPRCRLLAPANEANTQKRSPSSPVSKAKGLPYHSEGLPSFSEATLETRQNAPQISVEPQRGSASSSGICFQFSSITDH